MVTDINSARSKGRKPGKGKGIGKERRLLDIRPQPDAELDRLVDDYEDKRDRRMKLTDDEAEAKQKVIAAMIKKNKGSYTTSEGKLVTLDKEEGYTLKVKKAAKPKEEDE